MKIEDLLKKYESVDNKTEVITDFYCNTKIYSIRNSDYKDCTNVCLTAGSHAEEAAGVEAVLKAIEKIKKLNYNYLVLPCRDPIGFQGIESFIKKTENLVPINTIKVNGIKIKLYEFKNCYFLYSEQHKLTINIFLKILSKIKCIIQLRKFIPIIVPAFYDNVDGINLYSKAHTVFINEDNNIQHFNTNFFKSKEKSILAIKNYIEEFNPQIIIDCHEGYDSGMYFYVLPHQFSIMKKIVRRLNEKGMELRDDEYCKCKGIILKENGTSLQNYFHTALLSITVESGPKNDFSTRVNMIVQAIETIICTLKEENYIGKFKED